MNDTVKEIVGILGDGEPELQVAAAQVLGELRPKDAAVTRALEEALLRGDERILGRYVLEALAKIATADAVRVLVRRLASGDGFADHVIHLLAEMGAAAHKALAEVFDEASADLKYRILEIFGRQPSKEAIPVMLRALADPANSEPASQALLANAPELPPALAKSVVTELGKVLGDKNLDVSEDCLAKMLLVLGRVGGDGARNTLVKFSTDRHSVEVRRAALLALRGLKLTPTQIKNVLSLLKDSSQKPLHGAARELLSEVDKWPDGSATILKNLLAGRAPEQRLFALRGLRTCHTPEVAKISMRFLGHADERFRRAAVVALEENSNAVEPLVRALQNERSPDQARVIAGILAQLGDHFPQKLFKAHAEKACKLLAAGEPMGEVLFEMLMQIDGGAAVELVVDKAIRLRRARRLQDCITILARSAQTTHITPEGRYQLAVARLLFDVESHAENGNHGDATMGFFAALVRDGFPVLERLKKESMVPPPAMLRVGQHFAEAVGPERRFGTEVLHHLATKHKDRTGEEARMMLRAF